MVTNSSKGISVFFFFLRFNNLFYLYFLLSKMVRFVLPKKLAVTEYECCLVTRYASSMAFTRISLK